ncbi:DNA repair protein RadC [Mesonia sp. K7]|uniref:RadC family protein n=1 Tax=Mesonia sp. K7 TaxID=2218606 RepID=UPI000DA95E7B|nr:DNA repair protein RadC [Mesonia sp. K7]PZD76995.1 hypothetical protein DNG35_10145 [Mesonia sp. K7]
MDNKSFTIKNWAQDDRPREKLLNKGRTAVSDAELIAILIGSGNKTESAVELSKRILASTDYKLNDLGKVSVNQLMKFNGIGEAKAITIVAALELGRRRKSEAVVKKNKITSSKDVFEVMNYQLGELKHEEFWILYLDNSNQIIEKFQLSKGGINSTIVDVRLVYKKALEIASVSLILVHNHPSGNLNPSSQDKQITRKLQKGGESLDIKVLDHLIITEKSYFSFADENLL